MMFQISVSIIQHITKWFPALTTQNALQSIAYHTVHVSAEYGYEKIIFRANVLPTVQMRKVKAL